VCSSDLSEQFGQYPHRRFTVLESELVDGMEFDGLVFLNPELFEYYTGDGKDYLTAITAHEAAHEWWYGRVGNDQALEPWLDEAFAAYSELLFYEHYYPGNLEWWWWTRVNRYPSSQCVDLPVYSFSTFRSYVDAVYLRGVTMLDAVRYRVGRQAFSDSLRELQSTGMGSMITSTDVFRIFQSHSLVPLSGLWGEFVCQAVPAEP
jgi:aminopeptidase N